MRNKLPNKFNPLSGFTLIELLMAITIIATLAVVVFVALNPAQRLKDTKDARRTADVDSILSAIHASIVDNKGTYPTNFPAAGTKKQLGTGDATTCTASVGTYCTGVTTACADLLTGGQNLSAYLKAVPVDPVAGTTATSAKTGYMVERDSNGIVTVTACYTDGTTAISSSR